MIPLYMYILGCVVSFTLGYIVALYSFKASKNKKDK